MVAHASPDIGIYGLTIGETDLYSTAFTSTSVSAGTTPAASSGEGGGSMGWLLTVLLVTLIARRRAVLA